VSAARTGLWRRAVDALASMPQGLRRALALALVLHAVGLAWGMPASDAWDVDGIAPRDFLPGLAETYTPGKYFTYPPLHLAVLAVLTLPVTLLAVARAGTTAVGDVMRVIIEPPYMTAMTLTARALAVGMSLGIILALAYLAAEIVPAVRRKGVLVGTAVVAAVNVSFTYYAHVSNLDVPYLFWASLAALSLVRAIARREPRRLRTMAVLAACAVATKDQAYAMYLLAVPLVLALWLALDRWARGNARRIFVDLAIGTALAAAFLAVVDGAVTNPSGFRARVAFLTGSASQDYATYSRDAVGRITLLVDVVRAFTMHYPAVIAAFLLVGVVDAIRSEKRRGPDSVRGDAPPSGIDPRARLVAALVPLAIALSFTLCFNMAARRVEERFTLPQMLMAAVYAGIGFDRLWSRIAPEGALVNLPARVACAAAIVLAAWQCVVLDANLLLEPRYDAEAYLASHARTDDVVEVHGLNVYLPRFPSGLRVVRVGPTPPEKRGPLPGVVEVQAPLAAIADRRPRFVVVSECYAWRYLERDLGGDSGHIVPVRQKDIAHDADASSFFNGLFRGQLGYHVARESRIRSTLFPRRELHASVGCPVFTFERN